MNTRKLVTATIILMRCLMAQNVGIGTSTPGSKLHVADGEIRLADPVNYSGFLLALPGHHGYYGAWALYGISSGNLHANPFIYVVRSTGNVGIGTISPAAQLHTTGTVRFANYASGPNGAILRTNNAGDLNITNFTGDAGDVLLGNATFGSVNSLAWRLTGNSGTNPANHFIGTTDNQPLVFRTNNTEKMRVTPTGFVGIGTSTPGSKLHVADGEIRLADPVSYSGFLLALPGHHGYYGAWALYGITSGNLHADPFIYVVRSSGNVGIGTTSPAAQLHTTGTVRFANYASGPNGAILRTNNTGDLAITDFTGNAGDVLLGNATFGSMNNLAWRLTGNSGTNPANHFIGTTDFKPLVFRVNNSQVMKIDEYGNVGIGIEPGPYRLLIGGPTTVLGLTSMNNSYPLIIDMGRYDVEMNLCIQSLPNQFAGGTQAGDVVFRAENPSKKMHFVAGVGNSPSLTVQSNRVGIGTTTPAHRLHVNGSAYTEQAYAAKPLVIQVGYSCSAIIPHAATQVILESTDADCEGANPPPVTYVATPIEGQYLWITNLSGQNRIFHQHLLPNNTVTGFVYTSSQWRPVSVAQANDPNAWKLTGNTVSGTQWLGTLNNSPLPFRTNNQERMRITSTGNIAVGTPTPHPSAILHLNSTDRGLLIPRMTTAQRNAISSPATALLIFNIDVGCFEFFDGSNWVSLTPCSVPCNSVGTIGSISGPTSICGNGSVGSFSISPVANATYYDWNFNGVITTTTVPNLNIAFNASHAPTSTLTVTARNSCSQGTSNTHTIQVGVLQTPPTISGPSSVCPNTTFQLTIQGGQGSGPIEISTSSSGPWTPLSGTLPITHTISSGIASTTKYYVRRGSSTSGCGASALDSVTVTVIPPLSAGYTPIIQASLGQGNFPPGSQNPADLTYITASTNLCPNRYKRYTVTNPPSGYQVYVSAVGAGSGVYHYNLGNGDVLIRPQSCPSSTVTLRVTLVSPCGNTYTYDSSITCAPGQWGSDALGCQIGSPPFSPSPGPACRVTLGPNDSYEPFNGYLQYQGQCYECNCY